MRYLLFLSVLLFLSCSKKEENSFRNSDGFMVKALIFGGGCSYSKEISVTEEQTKIAIKGGNCGSKNLNQINSTDLVKLAKLKSLLQEIEFKNLKLNDCARCLDGEDYRIQLIDKGQSFENTIGMIVVEENLTPTQQKIKELQELLKTF